MFLDKSDFYLKADVFLNKLFEQMHQSKIKLRSDWEIDHICYRVSSDLIYETLKQKMLDFSALLAENLVRGRNIATFKLEEPLSFQGRSIPLVELPSPKPGQVGPKNKDGFEHIEVVCDLSFDKIKSIYPHASFCETAVAQKVNPSLELIIGDFAIKFHHQSLEAIILQEKNGS